MKRVKFELTVFAVLFFRFFFSNIYGLIACNIRVNNDFNDFSCQTCDTKRGARNYLKDGGCCGGGVVCMFKC